MEDVDNIKTAINDINSEEEIKENKKFLFIKK